MINFDWTIVRASEWFSINHKPQIYLFFFMLETIVVRVHLVLSVNFWHPQSHVELNSGYARLLTISLQAPDFSDTIVDEDERWINNDHLTVVFEAYS